MTAASPSRTHHRRQFNKLGGVWIFLISRQSWTGRWRVTVLPNRRSYTRVNRRDEYTCSPEAARSLLPTDRNCVRGALCFILKLETTGWRKMKKKRRESEDKNGKRNCGNCVKLLGWILLPTLACLLTHSRFDFREKYLRKEEKQ